MRRGRTAKQQELGALTLGALGVVYGDIGTSPLYAVREVLTPDAGAPLEATAVIGAISAILWALMVVVTLKYVLLVLRADNKGEGGIMALTALALEAFPGKPGRRQLILLTGVFGAALFYGDSVITPAISVLGALEGLETINPDFADWILPVSVAVLLLLFMLQRRGTAVVGKLFGPVMLLWFGVIGIAGLLQIREAPHILAALNPLYGLAFLQEQGWTVFIVVGAIVLALTGAEALYADLGHFGRRPIRLAWTGLVLPALALNYLGQGALLIRNPDAIENPFFHLFPDTLRIPAVVLATAASVIASQAVISGAFSLTREAIQLGLLPACASATPPTAAWGRSTCRPSTACCSWRCCSPCSASAVPPPSPPHTASR